MNNIFENKNSYVFDVLFHVSSVMGLQVDTYVLAQNDGTVQFNCER